MVYRVASHRGAEGAEGGAESWADLLGAQLDTLDLRLLRRCTYAGRPYGEKNFVALFEQHFSRVWRVWGFESERETAGFAS